MYKGAGQTLWVCRRALVVDLVVGTTAERRSKARADAPGRPGVD